MTACHCPSCSATPSEKYSDRWKTETEAHLVLTMPVEGRRKYLDMLKGTRRTVLEAEIKKQWNARHKIVDNDVARE